MKDEEEILDFDAFSETEMLENGDEHLHIIVVLYDGLYLLPLIAGCSAKRFEKDLIPMARSLFKQYEAGGFKDAFVYFCIPGRTLVSEALMVCTNNPCRLALSGKLSGNN